MPRTKSALAERSTKRETISQHYITGAERAKDGHIQLWTRNVREVVSEYLKVCADDPHATVIITLETQPGPVEPKVAG